MKPTTLFPANTPPPTHTVRRVGGWRTGVLSAVIVMMLAGVATYVEYARELRATQERLTQGSQVILTRHGAIEYASWGSGPAVLVLHGAGGGYDQGMLIARAFGGEGFRWISPSRFGYLRTPLPADASTAAQADAVAEVLDSLKVEQVAIVAMSGGVPPALQFAQHYPERTSALVLISSAPYTPLTAGEQKLPVPIWVYRALFSSNLPYWLLQKIARSSLEPVFDITPTLRAQAPAAEQGFIDATIDAFQPVTERMAGLNNEGAAIDPAAQYHLEAIAMPTLVVHAQDDHLNPFSFGEYTASHIPGAQFMPLTSGGHMLIGHHAEVRARVAAFLGDHISATHP